MKFHQTEFAHELFAVVVGTLFLVASFAFLTLPAAQIYTAATWHLS